MFDGELVAKAYNRIIPTYQGYFIELEENDIIWTYLQRDHFPAWGDDSWITPGLSVFRLSRPDTRRTPKPHRFALKTPANYTHPCNPLLHNKWYIHA